MERQVYRRDKIPSFTVKLGELEALADRLVGWFEQSTSQHSSQIITIEFMLKGEKLVFKNFEEIREYDQLPDKVKRWSLSVYQDDHRVSINSKELFSLHASVDVYGKSEAWCAGAMETVLNFLRIHTIWYSSFMRLPLTIFAFSLLCANTFYVFVSEDYKTTSSARGSVIFCVLVLCILQHYVLDRSLLVIRGPRNKIREYVPEIGLAVAILALTVSLIALF